MNPSDIDVKPERPSLTAGLPAHLKDPKNFDKIQKAIIETVRRCKKAHSDVIAAASCMTCTKAMLERRALLKKLGFKNPAQYMAWRKIHETIKARVPYEKYNSK